MLTRWSILTKCFTCQVHSSWPYDPTAKGWRCTACGRIYPTKFYVVEEENARARRHRLFLKYKLFVEPTLLRSSHVLNPS